MADAGRSRGVPCMSVSTYKIHSIAVLSAQEWLGRTGSGSEQKKKPTLMRRLTAGHYPAGGKVSPLLLPLTAASICFISLSKSLPKAGEMVVAGFGSGMSECSGRWPQALLQAPKAPESIEWRHRKPLYSSTRKHWQGKAATRLSLA